MPTILALACAEPAPQGQSVSGSEIGATAESVTYVEATPAVTNTLRASGQSGLLGAPLPEGAALVGSNEGGGSQAPSQRYELNASAEEIGAFFQESLAEAGWEQDGSPSGGSFYFRRGSLILGVLISGKGGTFTLISS